MSGKKSVSHLNMHINNRKAKQEFKASKREVDPNKKVIKASVQAKNQFQKDLFKALASKQVVVVIAPAGTGKSYCVMSDVIDRYQKGEIDNIKLSRPSVGMGESLGMLKGSLEEKYTPYLLPLIDVITERYGRGVYETALKNGNIEMTPLEYVRGRNFTGVVIVDESQNMTPKETYSVLTRIAEGGQLILIGDPTQTDIKGKNGLDWLRDFKYRHGLGDDIAMIEATSEDIVRSSFCKLVVQAMESEGLTN